MQKIIDNDGAFAIFDRIEFADKPEESMSSPCSMGAVPRQAKAFLPRIPLVSTIKQRPDYRGFFVRAVLSDDTKRISRRRGRIDERNHVSASRGRSVISQDAQDVGVKGLNHSATVSSVRAVADADSSEPTMKLHAGTANRTVSRIGFNPTPALGLVSLNKGN